MWLCIPCRLKWLTCLKPIREKWPFPPMTKACLFLRGLNKAERKHWMGKIIQRKKENSTCRNSVVERKVWWFAVRILWSFTFKGHWLFKFFSLFLFFCLRSVYWGSSLYQLGFYLPESHPRLCDQNPSVISLLDNGIKCILICLQCQDLWLQDRLWSRH